MHGLPAQVAFLPFIVLTAIGVYLMLSHRNFLKALVGLSIFQTAIILFFTVLAVRAGGTIPILNEKPGGPDAGHAAPADHADDAAPAAADGAAAHGSHYDERTVMHNPLPHALMLTAIVVGVATQGVGLAVLRRIKDETGTIEDTDTESEDV